MAVKENFRNYVRRAGAIDMSPGRKIVLLANGPSLSKELPELIVRGDHLTHDVLAVNYFACDAAFEVVRPKYYVLSDPTFFRRRSDWQRVEALYETLDRKVAWPMNLYVQFYNPDRFDYRSRLSNPHIRIVPFHSLLYRGFPSWGFRLFRHGIGSGNYGTVIQNGEFIAMLLGYRELHLYGVDHTFFDGLCVDGENRVCVRSGYFYDAVPKLKPLSINSLDPPKPYTMHEYLAEKAELFRGHEVLAGYADRLGVRIVNHTACSLIDAYERESADSIQ